MLFLRQLEGYGGWWRNPEIAPRNETVVRLIGEGSVDSPATIAESYGVDGPKLCPGLV